MSAILLLFTFEFMIHNIISKFHLFHIIFAFILFYKYSHGFTFDDHGLYNLLGVISLLIILIISLLPVNLLFCIIKKKNKIILYIYLIFLLIFFISLNYYIYNFVHCHDWGKGLNNTFINNDIKFGCKIKIPKYCPYKFLHYLLDISKLKRIKCGDIKAKKKLLKFSNSKYITKKTKKFGFPVINENLIWPNNSRIRKSVSSMMSKNLIDMENLELLNSKIIDNKPEIIVDFSQNEKGKMLINLTFNESLSKERKKLEKKYHPYSNNILILYLDSVSRVNGIRQLKKTLSFFENFMPYNSTKFHSFQFFKYHSFHFFTPGNYPKLFFDTYRVRGRGFRISYYLKKYGFVTAFSNDMCMFNPYYNFLYEFTKDELCDHEFLLCDPNIKHINSMTKKCLYEHTNIYYQYEYGLQFWRLYKDNRKFLLLVNNDGHEGTLELIKYNDDVIFKFLDTLYKDNLLDNTTILLLSDHGCSLPSVYYFNDFFKIEKHLPMLYIMIPDRINETYHQQYHNIFENQQKFITAFDIYNTLRFLMLGKNHNKNKFNEDNYIHKSKFGINLFEPINKKRNPKNYKNLVNNICI